MNRNKPNIHVVNEIVVVRLQDKRTGSYSENVRECSTPFGIFRSVGLFVDFAIANLPHECGNYQHLSPEDARKRLYQKMYQRCLKGSRGYRLM